MNTEVRQKRCETCGHVACLDCTPTVYNMARIEGLVCCHCFKTASLEVWQSGDRY